MKPHRVFRVVMTLAGAAALMLAPGCTDDEPPASAQIQSEPELGETSFVSAAFGPGVVGTRDQASYGGSDVGAPTAGGGGGAEERTVEEGDIYRLLDAGHVLNLNPYRGLQVIDVTQLDAPEIIGRARLAGQPVELYVVGDHAIVLLNQWRGYYGGADVAGVESLDGGAALVVDLSDVTAPKVVDRVAVGDSIVRSRLTRQGDQVALYVAAQQWQEQTNTGGGATVGVAFPGGVSVSETPTLVKSFQLVGDKLEARGEVDLGGYVSAIQATPEALLVARLDWQSSQTESQIAVVDISDPTGNLGAQGEVTVPGYVQNQFNMDLYEGVLRVVSGSGWDASTTNQVATFDASDLTAMTPVDVCAFGPGESLFATLFMGPKAFFVTYERVDPFHAFELTPEGSCIPHAEYVVSGWNDFFKPALGDTRLLGVGVNDEGGARKVAVSLYDITDLDNPTPMVARAEVDLDNSWSEASWEHRAFTVLDDAVDLSSDSADAEHGLVLVPFTGWSDQGGYLSGVQIFTYSPVSLTARGVLHHDAPVRRSFPTTPTTTAALSDLALQLYDTADLDTPTAGGEVALAPEYSQVLAFGDYAARVVGGDYWWYYGYESEMPDWSLEVVSLAGDPDIAPALAQVAIPRGATVEKVGDSLVAAIVQSWKETADGKGQLVGHVDVFDLSDPTAPALVGSIDDVPVGGYDYGYYGAPMAADCFDCGGYGYYGSVRAYVVGDALVFPEATQQSEQAGSYELCETYPASQGGGGVSGGGGGTDVPPSSGSSGGGATPTPATPDSGKADGDDTYLEGYIHCVSYDGGPEQCWGSIWQCSGFEADCVEIEPSADQVVTNCTTQPYDRYWQSYTLHVLDLSTPSAPALAPSVEMPVADAGIAFVSDADRLLYSYYRPVEVSGDAKPYVKWFFREVSLADPGAPALGDEVNVPGKLLAASGSDVFTQDYVYAADSVESAVSRLSVSGAVATLEARHRFEGQAVQVVQLDGAGHVLVTHGNEAMWMQWYAYDAVGGYGGYGGGYDGQLQLTVLDVATLTGQATVDVASWATLREAVAGRAVFEVPGGVLVIDTEDASSPTPQAYFPTQGWPQELLVEDGNILFAAGRYGLYKFGLDEVNLIPKAN